jgi:hypothetical protein
MKESGPLFAPLSKLDCASFDAVSFARKHRSKIDFKIVNPLHAAMSVSRPKTSRNSTNTKNRYELAFDQALQDRKELEGIATI